MAKRVKKNTAAPRRIKTTRERFDGKYEIVGGKSRVDKDKDNVWVKDGNGDWLKSVQGVLYKTGCWAWTAARQNKRRGSGQCGCMFDPEVGKTVAAHKVAWRIFRFEEVGDKHIAHTCRNTVCVNPDHLYLTDKPPTLFGASHPKAKLTESQVRRLRKRYRPNKDRMTLERVATEEIDGRPAVNVTREAIRRLVGGESGGGGVNGIDPKDVARLRRAYEPPVTLSQLAEEELPGVSISKSALASAAAGRTWSHLNEDDDTSG
jgi:hypothetical protein